MRIEIEGQTRCPEVNAVKFKLSIVNLTVAAGVLTVWTALASAQGAISGNQERLAAQAAPAQPDSGEGMGMGMMNGGPMMGAQGMTGNHGMMGGQGMMGARQMREMPMTMPYCGDGMMGPGSMMGMGPMMMRGMMGSAKDLKTAARMMEMRADMMKASAQVMEKYAGEMDGGK